MPTPYLIAHVVRGEPAFDIAIPLQIGDEEGWIIPTSGHRAYPYWQKPLHELGIDQGPDTCWAWGWNNETGTCQGLIPIPPDDWPDHYPHRASPAEARTKAPSLLAALGLTPKRDPIKRRV